MNRFLPSAWPACCWSWPPRGQLRHLHKGGLGATCGEACYVGSKVKMHLRNALPNCDF